MASESFSFNAKAGAWLSDFCTFRKVVSPTLIKILFWPAVLASFWRGMVEFNPPRFMDMQRPSVDPIPIILVFFIAIPMTLRITAELLIIVCRMNEALSDIRTNTQPSAGD